MGKQVQASKQVKTPDEVEDLPEHEAVEPEPKLVVINNVEVTAQESFEETEEKIILDQQEKETLEGKDMSEIKDKEQKTEEHDQKSEENKDEKITEKEAAVSEEEKEKELFEDNDISKEDGKEKTESEGAQEQRELSEVIVSAQQIPEKSSPEEPDTVPEPAAETAANQKAEEPQQSQFQVEMEKLEGVLSTIINMYQDELKICKQIPSSSNNSNQSKQHEDDISVELEASINLLSSLDSSADSDSAVVLKATLETCSTTII